MKRFSGPLSCGLLAVASAFADPPEWANLAAIKHARYLAFANEREFYAFGDFDSIGNAPAHRFAKWTEYGWQGLTSPTIWKKVYATAVDGNGRLFASGECEGGWGSGSSCFGVWDGSEWRPVPLSAGGRVNAVTAGKGGSVFIGGAFSTVAGVAANSVAKWDGSAWSALGAGADTAVWAIGLDRRDSALLVVSKFLGAASEKIKLARWDGAWETVATDSLRPYHAAAFGPGGELFVSGSPFISGASPPVFKRYSNGKWDTIGTGFDFQEGADSLFVDGAGTLWAIGNFRDPRTAFSWCDGAKWDGQVWQRCAIPEDMGFFTLTPAGTLVAAGPGGIFLRAKDDWRAIGGIPNSGRYDKMARDGSGNAYLSRDSLVFVWDGMGLRPLGASLPGPVTGLETGPKGGLFAAGRYGLDDSGFVRKWNGAAWTPVGSPSLNSPVDFLSVDAKGRPHIVTSIFAKRWDDTGWTDLGTAYNGPDSKSAISFDKNGNVYKTDNGKVLVKTDTGWSMPGFWGKPGVWQRYLASEIFFDPSGSAYVVVSEPPAAVSLPNWKGFSIVKWDGTALKELGGFASNLAQTRLLSHAFDSKDNLYIAGIFDQVYTSTTASVAGKSILKWDGTSWSALGSGIAYSSRHPEAGAVAVDSRDNLLVAGLFDKAGGISCPHFSIYGATGFQAPIPVRIAPAPAAGKKPRLSAHPGGLRLQGVLPTDRILIYALNGKLLLASPGKPELGVPLVSRQPLVVRILRNNAPLLSKIVMR